MKNYTMEDKFNLHKELSDKLNTIYRAKNTDYDDSFAKGIDSMGYITAITRMDDKLNRIKSLLVTHNGESKVDESVQDTLLDLANYTIMLLTEYEIRNS